MPSCKETDSCEVVVGFLRREEYVRLDKKWLFSGSSEFNKIPLFQFSVFLSFPISAPTFM